MFEGDLLSSVGNILLFILFVFVVTFAILVGYRYAKKAAGWVAKPSYETY